MALKLLHSGSRIWLHMLRSNHAAVVEVRVHVVSLQVLQQHLVSRASQQQPVNPESRAHLAGTRQHLRQQRLQQECLHQAGRLSLSVGSLRTAACLWRSWGGRRQIKQHWSLLVNLHPQHQLHHLQQRQQQHQVCLLCTAPWVTSCFG